MRVTEGASRRTNDFRLSALTACDRVRRIVVGEVHKNQLAVIAHSTLKVSSPPSRSTVKVLPGSINND